MALLAQIHVISFQQKYPAKFGLVFQTVPLGLSSLNIMDPQAFSKGLPHFPPKKIIIISIPVTGSHSLCWKKSRQKMTVPWCTVHLMQLHLYESGLCMEVHSVPLKQIGSRTAN